MSKDDEDRRDALARMASVNAKLARHERLTGIILFLLTFLATLALGLAVAHIAGGM